MPNCWSDIPSEHSARRKTARPTGSDTAADVVQALPGHKSSIASNLGSGCSGVENPALAANAAFTKIKSSNDAAVYAYTRQVGARKLLVLLNLSNKLQNFTLTGAAIAGRPKNVFTGADEELKDDQSFKLDGWGYTVYSY